MVGISVRASPPYLCDQDVCQFVDGVVPVAGRDEAFSPPLFETRQEVCVKVEEVFQAGKQTVQPSCVHLEVLLQLPDVDVQHDLQSPHMMHLCLHQLYRTTRMFCNARVCVVH